MSEPDLTDSVVPVPLQVGPYRLDVPAASDTADVVAAFHDPDIATWNPAGGGEISAEERAPLWIADRATWTSQHASWVVRDHDGTVIGQVSLHQIDPRNGSAEVGYWLAPAGRGRGLATHALDTAARFAFDVLELARVELFHATGNLASCRVAERAGFLLEGTARQSFVYGDGQRHDEHVHARLATDPAPELAPLR